MAGDTVMRYFLTPQNTVRAIEEGQEYLIEDNWVEKTWAQASVLIEENRLERSPKTQFTSLEYLDRFTQAEQELIVAATVQNLQLKLFYDRLLAATFIDLEDPRTAAGLDALIAAGLLNASRKPELLQPE